MAGTTFSAGELAGADAAVGGAGDRSSSMAAAVSAEVGDVTRLLQGHADQTAQQLIRAITIAKQNLGVSSWSAVQRGVADRAERSLVADVDTTLMSVTEAVGLLRARLLSMVHRFQADMDSRYEQVLAEIGSTYAHLAEGAPPHTGGTDDTTVTDVDPVPVAG